jgi:uncharacterized membrane protein
MITAAHLHPIIVHAPLALWVTVPVLYAMARRAAASPHAELYAAAGTINLLVGTVASVFAVLSGLLAVSGLSVVGIAQSTLSRHIAWGVATSFVYLCITLLRTVGRPISDIPGRSLVVVLFLVTLPVVATGYYGGQNVYRFGLGVDLATANDRAMHPPVPKTTRSP